jgi:hypothetical protein
VLEGLMIKMSRAEFDKKYQGKSAIVVLFSVLGDVSKAHRRFKYLEVEHGFLACQVDPNDDIIYVNKVGTFGVGSASYWWGRIFGAAQPTSLLQQRLPVAEVHTLCFSPANPAQLTLAIQVLPPGPGGGEATTGERTAAEWELKSLKAEIEAESRQRAVLQRQQVQLEESRIVACKGEANQLFQQVEIRERMLGESEAEAARKVSNWEASLQAREAELLGRAHVAEALADAMQNRELALQGSEASLAEFARNAETRAEASEVKLSSARLLMSKAAAASEELAARRGATSTTEELAARSPRLASKDSGKTVNLHKDLLELEAQAGDAQLGFSFDGLPPLKMVVTRLLKGSWAHRGDVHPTDELVSLDGREAKEMSVTDVFDALLGRALVQSDSREACQ